MLRLATTITKVLVLYKFEYGVPSFAEGKDIRSCPFQKVMAQNIADGLNNYAKYYIGAGSQGVYAIKQIPDMYPESYYVYATVAHPGYVDKIWVDSSCMSRVQFTLTERQSGALALNLRGIAECLLKLLSQVSDAEFSIEGTLNENTCG